MEEKKQGMLYLCATPIGNLKDITERVLETLQSVDVIAAEDTRNSIHLLTHFGIKTPLTSYHEYNKYDKAEVLIGRMRAGEDVALITDAGTPAISDPGEVLVQMCNDAGIRVTSLPGAAACITALTLSGLHTRRFCFEGFLPSDKKELADVLEDLKKEYRTIIVYEAPHHLKKTLSLLSDTLGDRKITICRELTKKFETVMPTTFHEALEYYESEEPRGEYVLVIEGADRDAAKRELQSSFESMSVEDHVAMYEAQGFDRKAAMKKAAEDRGVPKREIYSILYK
jgi:16S rRNA (cytidine1402-2'-O)-methyltransferase